MSDIVQQLRDRAYSSKIIDRLCEQAADEIARLRLTDEEREAVETAALEADAYQHAERAATLRGLMERLK